MRAASSFRDLNRAHQRTDTTKRVNQAAISAAIEYARIQAEEANAKLRQKSEMAIERAKQSAAEEAARQAVGERLSTLQKKPEQRGKLPFCLLKVVVTQQKVHELACQTRSYQTCPPA